MKLLYKIENINLEYHSNNNDTKILKNINFEVKKNERLAIIGESGSGKTSLLMLLSGLEKPTKGLNRFHWNLRYEVTNPINLSSPSFYNPFAGTREGTLVEPGEYTVQMDYLEDGNVTSLVEPKSFTVTLLENTVLPAEDRKAKVKFQRDVAKMQGEISSYSSILY